MGAIVPCTREIKLSLLAPIFPVVVECLKRISIEGHCDLIL